MNNVNAFLETLRIQRWDDHRYYHHSRVNQSLHLISAISFLVAYAMVFSDPATAALIAWLVSMVTRQAGHFFFEPKGYDEINEFEAQLTGNRTNLVKLFIHVTQEEQDKRFADRLDNPWKRWKTGTEDYRNRAKRKDYLAAMDEMFAQTNTRWAPWKVIDGNNKKAARIAALTHIIETLEAVVPLTPPELDPAVVKLAAKAFGYKPKD